MTQPSLILTPRRRALLAGHDNRLEVLVRVQAPEAPPALQPKRLPLHVALVIDRSGSMSGKPLQEARRCAAHVIDGLQPTDVASLVVYDDDVQTIVPAGPIGDRSRFHAALRTVRSGGTTNLHGGWLRGAETLAPLTNAETLSRVILLSDGCANAGLTDVAAIERQCRELAEAGVTTSTYGLGHNFNEALMVAMAQAGGGNHYYGQTAEDLMAPFQEELALMKATAARTVRLRLEAPAGVTVQVLNDYLREDGAWRLPDLLYGGEAWALVRMTVPASVAAAGVGADLLTAHVSYVDESGERVGLAPAGIRLPALPADAFAAVAEDELVARRAKEIEAAHIQRRARQAAQANDWAEVERLLGELEVLARDHAWIEGVLAELRALAARRDAPLLAREALYSARSMSSRVAACAERASLDEATDMPAFLRRKTSQGKAPGGERKGP